MGVMRVVSLPILATLVLLAGCAGGPGRFEIALIGDQQYGPESEAQFPHIMDDLNRAEVSFVVHIGDIKAGTYQPCDDALLTSRRDQFDASRHPLVFTPGDNDWTDCHFPKSGGVDPIERLAKLREVFYPDNRSLGRRKLVLEQQSEHPRYAKFRENARWRLGGVLFATLHLVGSNNNLGRAPEQDEEYRERNAANLAWLKDTFDVAKREGSKGVALFIQANPRFENLFPKQRIGPLGLAPPSPKPTGFADFVPALAQEVVAFEKPVVLFHGDTHYFRIDKPLFRGGPGPFGRHIENFTRVEVHGFPNPHWVRIVVDPSDPAVFSFREQIVERNRYRKQ